MTLLIALVVVASPMSAFADVIYVFDQTNYDVAAGATVDVQVFLQQDGTVDTILTDEGLESGSVRVHFAGIAGTTQPAQVLSETDILPNPSFDDPLIGLDLESGVSAGLAAGVDFSSAYLFGDTILLGTFTFTAGNVLGEVTQLSAKDFDLDLADTIAGNGTALDGFIGNGFATITVTAVPEPNSLAWLCLGSATLTTARRRRNHRKAASCLSQ